LLSNSLRFVYIKLIKQQHKQQLPMTISITFLTVYIAIGAYIFNNLEKWSLIESAYFSFITLATIGFGDLVPGSNNKTTSLILACVYIIIGLAVLSMVFNLMEQEIMNNIHWLALKINIIIINKKKSKQTKKLKRNKQNKQV